MVSVLTNTVIKS